MKRVACWLLLCGSWVGTGQEIGVLSGLRDRYRQNDTAGMTTDQRITYWEQKVKAEPKNLEAMLNLAGAFLQKNRETTDFSYVDRASGLVDRVLTADAGNYNALRLRLEVAMNYHRFPRVIDYAEQLLERNPSDAGVTALMGDALMEMGRYDEAGRVYKRMTDLGGNLFSYNRYAYYLFVTGRTQEALAWMMQAVESGSPQPENEAWCLVELGDLLFKTGKVKERGIGLPTFAQQSGGVSSRQCRSGETCGGARRFQGGDPVFPGSPGGRAVSGICSRSRCLAATHRKHRRGRPPTQSRGCD